MDATLRAGYVEERALPHADQIYPFLAVVFPFEDNLDGERIAHRPLLFNCSSTDLFLMIAV